METQKKPSKFAVGAFVVMLITSVVLGVKQKVDERRPVNATVVIAGNSFDAEVASSPKKRELGLGGRESLPKDWGMYFPFDTPQRWMFWMKGMLIPIDIIWINDGRVVDITRRAPPPGEGETPLTFSPEQPADAVFEVASGTAERLGLKAGDEVILKP